MTNRKVKVLSKKARAKNPQKIRMKNVAGEVTSIGYFAQGLVQSSKVFKSKSYAFWKEKWGGKGAGLAAMVELKLPVPPAFNLSTALCIDYLLNKKLPESLALECRKAVQGMETNLKKKFGSVDSPLLVSVRSGARVSMPGMMDTILNLGLNREIAQALSERSPEKARFWWDCYRRLIQMYGEVVMGIEYSIFDQILANWKAREGVSEDAKLSVGALQNICLDFEASLKARSLEFPQDPWAQLMGAIEAVFKSWNTERAVAYRRIHKIPDTWGTAVNVQAMVFGNLNQNSATGVVFTRNPSTGEKEIYGEYLINAQGEDVVAGIRTPEPIVDLKAQMPKVYAELLKHLVRVEKHFKDVQDVEFTIEDGRLYILQTRGAKRTASALVEHLSQMVKEKTLKPEEALERLGFDQVKQLLHPTLKATEQKPIVRGLPASPGAVSGRACFDPQEAVDKARAGQRVVLVRRDTSPEDIMGMAASEGILTSTGGMTSHAAVVGRGMGKACVVGCSDLQVNEESRRASTSRGSFSEGDWITINGSTGDVYLGELETEPVTWGKTAKEVFSWADRFSNLPVLANADTPEQASLALELGARGIGLCRTEHMFFDKERIRGFRQMILSENEADRARAASKLEVYQESDFFEILKVMKGYSVCVRLLDPPLHEFLPSLDHEEELEKLVNDLGVSMTRLKTRIQQLHEVNPMLGHRGCRLGVTFPGIYEMQVRALAQAMVRNLQEGRETKLKIMLPLVMNERELETLLERLQKAYALRVDELTSADSNLKKRALKNTLWGTMIELPRACLVAGEISKRVQFVSFGTNDLTQTTLGLSRDDASKFIPAYMAEGLLSKDPFETLDSEGVGRLIDWAVREGRKANPRLEVGICGEHGGDPESVKFFNQLKFDSISCSPFRVPVARLAAARASIERK